MSCVLGSQTAGARSVVMNPTTTTFKAGTVLRMELTFDTPQPEADITFMCGFIGAFWSQINQDPNRLADLTFLSLNTIDIIVEARLLQESTLPLSPTDISTTPGTLTVYELQTTNPLIAPLPLLLIGGALLLILWD